jgi:hypothetical protein
MQSGRSSRSGKKPKQQPRPQQAEESTPSKPPPADPDLLQEATKAKDPSKIKTR